MRKTLSSLFLVASLSGFASESVDLAQDAATVMEFQSAVAKYDEDKAMSYLANDVVLVFNQGFADEKTFTGETEVRKAYEANWFHVPSKMLNLDEASLSYASSGEFVYSFKGTFSLYDGVRNWRDVSRQSTSYFTIKNSKIVQIRRFQNCASN